MDTEVSQRIYSGFWPVVLVSLSSIVLLSWNLYTGSQQLGTGHEVLQKQAEQLAQAANAEAALKAIMADLIELGKDDADAARILAKYRISMVQPDGADDSGAAPETAAEDPVLK